jgi:hypothetical protein
MIRASAIAYVVCGLTVIACVGILFQMREDHWPGLNCDAVLFVTVPVNEASGRGHNYAVFSFTYLVSHDWSFRAHGQLYQAVLATLMSEGNMMALLDAVGTINIITVILFALHAFVRCRYVVGFGPWSTTAITSLGTLALAAVLVWLQGRPEHLVPLLVTLGGLGRLIITNPWGRLVVSGVELGLIGATSPLPGILAASTWVLLFALERDRLGRLAVRTALLGLCAALAWYVTICLIYPYDVLQLIVNTANGGLGKPITGRRFLARFWLFYGDFPLIGLLFVAAAGWGMWVFLRTSFSWLQRALIVVLALHLAMWVYRAGIVYPPLLYNLIGFYPVVYLGLVERLWRSDVQIAMPAIVRRSLACVALVGAIGTSCGFARQTLLLESYRTEGVSLTEARQRARQEFSRLSSNERVGIQGTLPPSLVVLDDPDWHLLSFLDPADSEFMETEKKLGIRFATALRLQLEDSDPPERWGPFVLRKDYFVRGRPTLWGMPLDHRIPGYQFAIYDRE